MKSTSLKIRTDNRVTICGMTKKGKTTLARYLFASMPQSLVLDQLDQYGDLAGPGKQVVFPRGEERAELKAICRQAWWIGNRTVFVEEAELALPEGRPLLPWTKKVI